jgi:hypothetical protein
MIVLKIDVTKIDKNHLYQGKSAKYLDAALHNRPDEYGNEGFITQSVSKEARARNEKGPIIGNWKNVGGASKPAQAESKPAKPKPPTDDDGDNSVPF